MRMPTWLQQVRHEPITTTPQTRKVEQMRLMLDAAVLPAEIPACDVLAGYITGGSVDHVWSPDDWARAKAHAAYILPIHVAAFDGDAVAGGAAGHVSVNDARGLGLGEGDAVCIDVEHSAAAHVVRSGYAAAWIGVVASAGLVPITYASASDVALVKPLGRLFLASWGKPAALIPGTVATQYDGGPGKAFDKSVVADGLQLHHTGKGGGAVSTTSRAPMVGTAPTPSGEGYWECDSDGAVFAFGDAVYHGGANSPDVSEFVIVGIAAHPREQGYWLTASDGGVFGFGAAKFHGAMVGGKLKPGI